MPDLKSNPSTTLRTGVLYYGDNLDILRKYIPAESVDLVYLDPPFNSKADYNVLFKEPTGERSAAQLRAFTDTWHWDRAAEETYQEIITNAPLNVSKAIEALRGFIGANDVMAYLVMMTVRLVELHRVLKPTGSLYLHCDPTASHYLKVVLDTIFGPNNFRNEIVWQRIGVHSDAQRYPRVSDRLLFYSKSREFVWNQVRHKGEQHAQDKHYRYEDERGRYRLDNLNPPGGRGPIYEFHGLTRPWRFTRENMLRLEAEGLIVSSHGGVPQIKRYFKPEIPATELWDDIPPINAQAKERLGYETQKPLALLERVISASSNPGDLVLDPFCGCGTAVVAAQKLGRRWVGIDITHLAITVMKRRLQDSFPGLKYEVVGEPKDLEGAKALARQDRYQFQWWALSLVGAQPRSEERKKGADAGVDGVLAFPDDAKGKALRAVVQVKSGHVGVKDIRDLEGVVDQKELGLFITLEPPTEPMRVKAVSAGFHESPLWKRSYPRIQILTVEELLAGVKPELPPQQLPSFAKAPRVDQSGQLAKQFPQLGQAAG